MLESTDIDPDSEWVSEPLQGVSEDIICNSLVGMEMEVNDTLWVIERDIIDSLVILNQETQLDKQRDIVDVNLQLVTDVYAIEGQLRITYSYANTWQPETVEHIKEFTNYYKENLASVLSIDDLAAFVAEKDIGIGMKVLGGGGTWQEIDIDKDNIQDFAIANNSSQLGGMRQLYDCTFMVDKGVAIIDVTATLDCHYSRENGWYASEIRFNPSVRSVDLVGGWIGGWSSNESIPDVL